MKDRYGRIIINAGAKYLLGVFLLIGFIPVHSAYGIVGDTLRESQEKYGPPTGVLRSDEKDIYVYEHAGFTITQTCTSDGVCINSFKTPINETSKKPHRVQVTRPKTSSQAKTPIFQLPSEKVSNSTLSQPLITIPQPSTKKADTSKLDFVLLIIFVAIISLVLGYIFSVIRKIKKAVATTKKTIKTVQKAGKFVNEKTTQPKPGPPRVSATYKGKTSALTNNEIQFHKALQKAVNNRCNILFQVSLGQLVDTCHRTYSEKVSARNRIDRKVMDFVLCDSDDLSTIAVIELDDKTHLRPARVKRDQFLEETLKEAGIPLIRFWSTAGSVYEPEVIESKLTHLFSKSTRPETTSDANEKYYRNYPQASGM